MEQCDGKALGLAFFRSPPQKFYWPGGALQPAEIFTGAKISSSIEILEVNSKECLWSYPFGTMYMGKDDDGRVIYACMSPPLPWGTEYDWMAEGPLGDLIMLIHRLYARVIVTTAAHTLRGLGNKQQAGRE
jgi:hypothetical protein